MLHTSCTHKDSGRLSQFSTPQRFRRSHLLARCLLELRQEQQFLFFSSLGSLVYIHRHERVAIFYFVTLAANGTVDNLLSFTISLERRKTGIAKLETSEGGPFGYPWVCRLAFLDSFQISLSHQSSGPGLTTLHESKLATSCPPT